jgi:uncharacterized protein YndB with AHSA1/START domain
MIRIESSIHIDRPRDEVFEFLTNVENLPKWHSGVIRSKPSTSGPVRLGSQFSEVVKVGPWTLDALCTVTDIRTNERFAFQMTSSGPLDCDARFGLQLAARGTRLMIDGTARLKGIWRLLQPLVAEELRNETRKELEAIRRLLAVESRPQVERHPQPV